MDVIPNSVAFPLAGGMVYSKGTPMPEGARNLPEGKTATDYVADGKGNWVIATKEKK